MESKTSNVEDLYTQIDQLAKKKKRRKNSKQGLAKLARVFVKNVAHEETSRAVH